MKVARSVIPEILIVELPVSRDERGFFFESYNARDLAKAAGITARFVQDSFSRSTRNVLRGLHYQLQQPQGKLVMVTAGTIADVVVDIRKSSPSFGRHVMNTISSDELVLLWIPPGFAHGFLVISEFADVWYKATEFWAPEHERCISWDDTDLNIPWPLEGRPILSMRDQAGVAFRNAEVFP